MDTRVRNHRVIGHEMSGKIIAMGEKIQGLEIGDAVVIRPLSACGDCPASQRGHAHIHAKTLKSLTSISTVPFNKSGAIDCNLMITDVRPLDENTGDFKALSGIAPAMESIINVLNSELLMCRKIS
jgi:hypothetical protein